MRVDIRSRFGRALYEALPEIYRTRDSQKKEDGGGEGHLAAYLDSCGELLDTVYNSLEQRYKDSFPETCQEWLLPYFAQLVGATTLSPHVEGRRKEIMHAVAWRQGKGSLKTVAHIAKEIGGFENLVVKEGWQRLARTARVDGSFASPKTVDLRKKAPEDFVGHRNTASHSVDVRKLSWQHGHANPHSVLLYATPYPGFFAGGEVITFKWKNKEPHANEDENIDNWFEKGNGSILPSELMGLDCDGETWSFYKKPDLTPGVRKIIQIEGKKKLAAVKQYRFSELNLEAISIHTGTHLSLEKLAVREVTVRNETTDTLNSSLVAKDCLLQDVKASNSAVQLVYCTVLGEMFAERLDASDCIFMETLFKNQQKRKGSPGAIRYSRYCPSQEDDAKTHCQKVEFANIVGNTTDVPVFFNKNWGKPGCGVIHPIAPESIRNGAEDGGEMGAFHHRAYVLAWEAVAQKLKDYLPIGMSATLIPDETLSEAD